VEFSGKYGCDIMQCDVSRLYTFCVVPVTRFGRLLSLYEFGWSVMYAWRDFDTFYTGILVPLRYIFYTSSREFSVLVTKHKLIALKSIIVRLWYDRRLTVQFCCAVWLYSLHRVRK